jgi:cytochrome c oxidase subunit 3
MPTVLVEKRKSTGFVPPPVPPDDWRDDGGSGDPGSSFPISKGQIGLWVLLTAIVMLFAGLSSAYIVLSGVPTWQNIALPSLLWVNTAILIISSGTIEWSRRALRANRISAMKWWLVITGILGMGFLLGQIAAWQQLVQAGVYLPSTLHSGFFYVLTGVHGLHLLGGIVAMAFVLSKAFRHRLTPAGHEPLSLCATYWHFMDGLWVYLAILLTLS